jgi:hypothetical protein
MSITSIPTPTVALNTTIEDAGWAGYNCFRSRWSNPYFGKEMRGCGEKVS